MRYIDADEFWNNRPENLDPKMSEFNRGWVAYAKAIRECLDETPTADVVEVVRCKDCSWYNSFTVSCGNTRGMFYANPNGYCSYGERREG